MSRKPTRDSTATFNATSISFPSTLIAAVFSGDFPITLIFFISSIIFGLLLSTEALPLNTPRSFFVFLTSNKPLRKVLLFILSSPLIIPVCFFTASSYPTPMRSCILFIQGLAISVSFLSITRLYILWYSVATCSNGSPL